MVAKKKVVKKRVAKKKVAKKRVVKKRIAKKRVGTSQTRKSMATRKAPTKRLKKRRAQNTKSGYYPNPISKIYRVFVSKPNGSGKYWYTGISLDTDKKLSAVFHSLSQVKKVAQDIADNLGAKYKIGIDADELKKK